MKSSLGWHLCALALFLSLVVTFVHLFVLLFKVYTKVLSLCLPWKCLLPCNTIPTSSDMGLWWLLNEEVALQDALGALRMDLRENFLILLMILT